MWDPADPKSKRYEVKFAHEERTPQGDSQFAIAMSDFIESQKPGPGKGGYFLPERFASEAVVDGKFHMNIAREVMPANLKLKPTEKLLPLHGLLGSLEN